MANALLFSILAALAGLGGGAVLSGFLFKNKQNKQIGETKEKIKSMLREAELTAETIKKDRMLEAKEKFFKLKAEFDEETNNKKNLIISNENKVKQLQQQVAKEQENVKRREAELDSKKENLTAQLHAVQVKKEELDRVTNQRIADLEKLAGLSREEAREQLVSMLTDEAQSKASSQIKDILDEAKLTATKQAKKIVLDTIQRTATEHAVENCVSIFNIESDDIKGKIIGREGRNIRALEAATGVEIVVDDTPEAIIISGFDPVRREIARLSLHRLVQDGRIHPARIEEVVAKTEKNIEEEIVEIGERTCIDLGIHGLHPELIKMVGRMRFRSSYGQNLLQHSREVAKLSATMAAEMGLNAKLAKRAGLLHDIGKVWPEEQELPHALLGMELAKRYKEHPEICNAIGAHHDEIEMTSMISPIVQASDAISGSRPGARREIMDSYVKRLKELEELALNFDWVNKCFAMQAGRELRIIVD